MRGSPLDREILRLAVPALGALAAEPLYLLVDTAIVGDLGTRPLAALALAATVLSTLVALCVFLTYATTAQVARLHGAGEVERAGAIAAQALWLALGLGAALALVCLLAAGPLIAGLGGDGETARLAERYLRISAIGLPAALVALAGQGVLRGTGDLRTPLVVIAIAQAANVVLEVLLVYGLDAGLDGSAAGTVAAQAGMGTTFAVLLLRAPTATRRPAWRLLRPLLTVSGELLVRTAALLAAFATASAVLARTGEASLAAHQIAFQMFIFTAMVLDALAIAAQVLVGRALGAGDAVGARVVALRCVLLGLLAGCAFGGVLLALGGVLPGLFTGDDAVRDRADAIWTMLALMQPAAGVVFALDGVLIGAGDARFLAGAMVLAGLGAYAPIALLALALGWGITGVWAGLLAMMGVRLLTLGARVRGDRWAVAGAVVRRAGAAL